MTAATLTAVPTKQSLTVQGLEKSYGHINILRGVDLKAEPGEFICILGPSGCGKTTLLRCVAGLENINGGSITLGYRVFVDDDSKVELPPEKRRLGMVFQNYALLPHLTVAQNIAYPLVRQKVSKAEIAERVERNLNRVGLAGMGEKYPGQLSGGQQQRVSLARAIASRPSLLLYDEPLSNLDTHLRDVLRQQIREVHDELGITTLYVTHDHAEAGALADRVAIVIEGQIAQFDKPEEVFRKPVNRDVAEFVGFDLFLDAVVNDVAESGVAVTVEATGEHLTVHTSKDVAVGEKVTVAFRRRVFRISTPGEQTTGEKFSDGVVVRRSNLGDVEEVSVEVQGIGVINVTALPGWRTEPLEVGDAIALNAPALAGVIV